MSDTGLIRIDLPNDLQRAIGPAPVNSPAFDTRPATEQPPPRHSRIPLSNSLADRDPALHCTSFWAEMNRRMPVIPPREPILFRRLHQRVQFILHYNLNFYGYLDMYAKFFRAFWGPKWWSPKEAKHWVVGIEDVRKLRGVGRMGETLAHRFIDAEARLEDEGVLEIDTNCKWQEHTEEGMREMLRTIRRC